MLRLIGNRIIIPRGDTGGFYLPMRRDYDENKTVVVFSVYNPINREYLIEKTFKIFDGTVYISLDYGDTMDIEAGRYNWDVKIIFDPKYDKDGNIIDAAQIDTYYTSRMSPLFIVKDASIPESFVNLREETAFRIIKER